MQNNDTETGTRKRQANEPEAEITALEQGQPKVKEYWTMVASELNELKVTNCTWDNTSDIDIDSQDMRESNP